METFYRLLKLDQKGVSFEFFQQFMENACYSLFMSIFIQPKYYVRDSHQERFYYVYSYFSDPKKLQLIVDLYHEPTKVFDRIGIYHPLWYISFQNDLTSMYNKCIWRAKANDSHYIALSDLQNKLTKIYQHMSRIWQLINTSNGWFRLECEYSSIYNIYYWKLNLPSFPELSCFSDQLHCFYYDWLAIYPTLSYDTKFSPKSYCVLNDSIVYLVNQEVRFDSGPFKYKMDEIETIINFVNHLDDYVNKPVRFDHHLVNFFYRKHKIYIYDDESRIAYLINLKAKKHPVQRVSYNQFAKMLLQHTF